MRKIAALFFLLFGILSIAEPVLACNPPPPPPTNLDCHNLGKGYQFGFQIDTARNGTYTFTTKYGTLTGDAPVDSKNFVKISNSDSRTFDWNASLGIDAVIVQAGGETKVTKLPADSSGKRFHGKTSSSGKPYQIANIEFCYDYELDVSIESQGSGSSSAAAWEITKSVSPLKQDKFIGEPAVFDYTVAVHKIPGGLTGNVVKSTVKIKNITPLTAKISSIVEALGPGDVAAKLDCGNIAFPYKLNSRKELVCTSTTAVETRLANSTVVVKTVNAVGVAKATTKIAWAEASAAPADAGATSVGATSITVTDTNAAFGGPYVVTGDQSWTYSVELACPVDPAVYQDGKQTTTLDNTAAITETGQKASQSVALDCYAPTLTSTTSAAYDVAYTWAITKTSLIKNLTLQVGETASVDYTVGVSVAKQDITNFKASAAVTVHNPNPSAEMTASLTDEILPGVAADLVDCANPLTIPAGGSLTCHFDGTVGSAQPAANNARLTMNNIDFTASTPYDFQNAAKSEVDECVTVKDGALPNPLGTVCADKAPATFNYSLVLGPYAQCRKTSTSYINTAFFVTNDTEASDFANWEVIIDVPCPPDTNCVRTIDYWKIHGDPANRTLYAKTWDKIPPSGPASPFFTTALTWYQMIQASPANQPYVQLAQAYIAAKLNVLYGAAANADVTARISHAEQLLAQYANTQGDVTGSIAQDFTDTAAALEKFNNGRSGPPVCYDCNER